MPKSIGRPVIVPRGPITAFGRRLGERGIRPKTLGEAIALAEGKPRQVRTVDVNRWIWGTARPSPARQILIAELLKLPVRTLFPEALAPAHAQAELELLAEAKRKPSRRRPRPSSPAAAAALIERESAQVLLSSAVSSTLPDNRCPDNPAVAARKAA